MGRFFLVLLVLSSCGLNDSDDVVCSKLVSSKGETIYVLSTNWGVTGDHQLSAVTTNKNKLNDSRDTAGSVKGLNPFEYRFNNDTLTLSFRNEINYHIAESFKTIAVQYQVMGSDYYEHRDTSFHSVPDLQPNTASDSPKPLFGVVSDYVAVVSGLRPYVMYFIEGINAGFVLNLSMSTGYQIYDPYGAYYLTFTIVDWVDLFTRKVYRDIMIDSLRYCTAHKGLLIYAYVIMSNHVHLIVQAAEAIPLSDIIRDCKKYTARQFLTTIASEPESRSDWLLHRFKYNAAAHQRNSLYQVWTHENHAVEINSLAFFEQKQNYIHQNPVRAGWVDFAEDYVYSSAYELAGRGSKLSIAIWR